MASDAFLPRGRGADRRRPRRPGERCVRGRRSCERTPRAGRLDDSRAQHHPGAAGSIHSFASAGRKSTDANGHSTARWRESNRTEPLTPYARTAETETLRLLEDALIAPRDHRLNEEYEPVIPIRGIDSPEG